MKGYKVFISSFLLMFIILSFKVYADSDLYLYDGDLPVKVVDKYKEIIFDYSNSEYKYWILYKSKEDWFYLYGSNQEWCGYKRIANGVPVIAFNNYKVDGLNQSTAKYQHFYIGNNGSSGSYGNGSSATIYSNLVGEKQSLNNAYIVMANCKLKMNTNILYNNNKSNYKEYTMLYSSTGKEQWIDYNSNPYFNSIDENLDIIIKLKKFWRTNWEVFYSFKGIQYQSPFKNIAKTDEIKSHLSKVMSNGYVIADLENDIKRKFGIWNAWASYTTVGYKQYQDDEFVYIRLDNVNVEDDITINLNSFVQSRLSPGDKTTLPFIVEPFAELISEFRTYYFYDEIVFLNKEIEQPSTPVYVEPPNLLNTYDDTNYLMKRKFTDTIKEFTKIGIGDIFEFKLDNCDELIMNGLLDGSVDVYVDGELYDSYNADQLGEVINDESFYARHGINIDTLDGLHNIALKVTEGEYYFDNVKTDGILQNLNTEIIENNQGEYVKIIDGDNFSEDLVKNTNSIIYWITLPLKTVSDIFGFVGKTMSESYESVKGGIMAITKFFDFLPYDMKLFIISLLTISAITGYVFRK